MLAKWWTEFQYSQEERHDSLYQLWQCLKRWWAYRPRIIGCAFCGQAMWENGDEGLTYCSPGCAYYDGVLQETEKLPF